MSNAIKWSLVVCCALIAVSVGYLAYAKWDERRAERAEEEAIVRQIALEEAERARSTRRKDLPHCRQFVDRNALLGLTPSSQKELEYCAEVVRAFEPESPALEKLERRSEFVPAKQD